MRTVIGGRGDRQRLRSPAQGRPQLHGLLREWEADVGFGVPTRVFNAVSLKDPREVISIGFVAVSPAELAEGLAAARDSEHVRHDRIDTVIETTTLRAMYEVQAEHDFSSVPRRIEMAEVESLLFGLR
jgi:hypothetical protein